MEWGGAQKNREYKAKTGHYWKNGGKSVNTGKTDEVFLKLTPAENKKIKVVKHIGSKVQQSNKYILN